MTSVFASMALAVALVGLNATAGAQSATDPPLSLAEALRLAQSRSGALAAQDAARRSAEESAVAAGRLPDPMLRAGVNNLPVTGSDAGSLTRDFMTMRSIGIAQEFTRGEKRDARRARFERAAEAADAGRAVALSMVQKGTAMAWLDRHYRERIVEVLNEQRVEAQLQIDGAQAAYRGGRGSQADVFAARAAVAQIDDRIAEARNQVDNARFALARWIGETRDRPLDATPSIAVSRVSASHVEPGLEHHPELQWMVRQEAVAQAEVAMAQADKRFDWSVEVMYSQRGPGYSSMVSVLFSVPLQWDQKNRQDRELAARLAGVDQARARREDMQRAHEAEVAAMLQEWRSHGARLQRFDTALLPLAAQRSEAALTAYRAGSGTLSAVLDARRGQLDLQLERLRLEGDRALLWAQLNYLIPAARRDAPVAALETTR